MKGIWTQELRVATLLDTQKDQGVSSFMTPQIIPFLKQVMPNSLRMLSTVGVINLGILSLKRNMYSNYCNRI